MASGFCPYLLGDIKNWYSPDIAPSEKVTETGVLNMLLNRKSSTTMINNLQSEGGYVREVRIKYMQRGVEAMVQESFSCDTGQTPGYKEVTVPVSKKVQESLFFDIATIRQYCSDGAAAEKSNWTTPATPVMKFVREAILTKLNGMYQKMSRRIAQDIILAAPVTATINLPLSGSTLDLNTGMQQLLGALEDVEFCGTPDIIGGSNLFRNFNMMKNSSALGMNQAGMMVDANALWNFYYQLNMRTLLATNDILAIDPGSVELIYQDLEVGAFSGSLGTSHFGQFIDPRFQCKVGNVYSGFPWEIQIKEIDCPTTLTNAYTGASGTYDRGYAVYIRKVYDTWVAPNDLYDGGDVISGQRGIKRFSITNV